MYHVLSFFSQLPRSMKILREFYFADWRYFVVCGNKFLRFGMTEISSGNQFLRFSVHISPKWHKSTKSVVFNLTEGS